MTGPDVGIFQYLFQFRSKTELKNRTKVKIEVKKTEPTTDSDAVDDDRHEDVSHSVCGSKTRWHIAKFWLFRPEKLDGTEPNCKSQRH